MTIITPDKDDWPYAPYELNEYGLINNAKAMPYDTKSMLNLARFFFPIRKFSKPF